LAEEGFRNATEIIMAVPHESCSASGANSIALGRPAPGAAARPETASAEACAALRHAAEPGPGFRPRIRRELLIRQLNILIEAQRAAAGVADRIRREAAQDELKTLAGTLRREKARWCNALSRNIRALGASPSAAIGSLYHQADILGDALATLAFLNRHEAWVIRRVEALLPHIAVDGLHADLLSMLAAQHYMLRESERVLRQLRARHAAGQGPPQPRRIV
jgi:hypothetical protein